MKNYYVLLFIAFTTEIAGAKIDYYWKDYTGEVPDDAFVAGTDRFGKPIYVGQGFYGNVGLLPGTLHPGNTTIRVAAGSHTYTTNKTVKILCSTCSHKLNWIKVQKYEDIGRLTNVLLVIGGQETATEVYIGRAFHEGSWEIGKIYNLAPFQVLGLPNIQDSITTFESFDILTYTLR